jgi:Protein of unknown function (DUF1566)/Collagen triple helix repeat (20 copies)
MNRFIGLIAGALGLLGLLSSPARAAGLPLIVSATVDYTQGTLTVSGQNFGSSPLVMLNSMTFPTLSSGSSQIVASFPSGNLPSSFTPGTYFLTLQFKNQLPSIFTVDVGANGAPGPAGAQGPAGAPGASGAPGPAGPAGPQGGLGPMGPPGAMGATGSAGPQGPSGMNGANGADGAAGPVGPAGPQGPQGPAGSSGTGGAPACTAPNIYLVISSGALMCQPRFNDNGDGTVTDNQTGLMWEKKTGTTSTTSNSTGFCPGNSATDVHDANNCYTWSITVTAADGPLFTIFLAALNGGEYYNPSTGEDVNADRPTTCLANHCDWRIPTIAELQAIIELTASGCRSGSICLDPAFAPAQASQYWSSSSVAGIETYAWFVSFYYGGTENALKNGIQSAQYAIAVRSGR